MKFRIDSIKALIVTLSTVFIISTLGLTGWNLVTYHNAHHNCVEIERLKSRTRLRANEDYHNLAKNAKILGIKLTPELIKAEQKVLARTLKDFAPEKCAGLFG